MPEPALPVSFVPASETEFRKRFRASGGGWITEYREGGDETRWYWKYRGLKDTTPLLGHVRSRSEYKCGRWRTSKILRVEFQAGPQDPSAPAPGCS